ncbi:MAG: hydrogenase expression/formation protein [archaeon]|nr:hydrogenase expression/formation protein [archaeon]
MSKDSETKKKFLPLGKLKMGLLKEIFSEYNSPEVLKELKNSGNEEKFKKSKSRVALGFSIGEDAALIEMNDHYLVSKTDPITFTTDEIGYYVVNVNANDIAAMGAQPKWFQATILLPESKTTEEEAKRICIDIQKACLKIGCVLTGGHTEVTYGLDRPIVIGSMLGEVKKDKYVKTSGGKPGDAIILTKGIPLEGTSIIAREKEKELKEKGISSEFIDKAKNLLHNPGISVIKEAILAVENFNIHSMHDPTEGGLAMGLVEMAKASNCGFIINSNDIPIIPEAIKLCQIYNLDPLRVISSGSLLIAINQNEAQSLLELFRENNISACKIGNLTKDLGYKIEENGIHDLKFSEKDQITLIFDN